MFIALTPDVQVALLGQGHGLLIGIDKFGQSPASLLLGHQKAVADQGLADIVAEKINS